MINEATEEISRLFVEKEKGEFEELDLSLPLQMLFDDVISFVSKTDF